MLFEGGFLNVFVKIINLKVLISRKIHVIIHEFDKKPNVALMIVMNRGGKIEIF